MTTTPTDPRPDETAAQRILREALGYNVRRREEANTDARNYADAADRARARYATLMDESASIYLALGTLTSHEALRTAAEDHAEPVEQGMEDQRTEALERPLDTAILTGTSQEPGREWWRAPHLPDPRVVLDKDGDRWEWALVATGPDAGRTAWIMASTADAAIPATYLRLEDVAETWGPLTPAPDTGAGDAPGEPETSPEDAADTPDGATLAGPWPTATGSPTPEPPETPQPAGSVASPLDQPEPEAPVWVSPTVGHRFSAGGEYAPGRRWWHRDYGTARLSTQGLRWSWLMEMEAERRG